MVVYLEPFVLQHSFDGGIFSAGGELGLEHDTKGAIADNLALCVLQFTCFTRQSVLDLLSYDFWRFVLVHVPVATRAERVMG